MGNNISIPPEQVEAIKTKTSFDAKELRRLYRRFSKIAVGANDISEDQFLHMAEFAGNPFAKRMFYLFDTNGNRRLDFAEFVIAMHQVQRLNDRNEKLRFAFRLFDEDGDNEVSHAELSKMMRAIVGGKLSDAQFDKIVKTTFSKFDKDDDGKINFDEFSVLLGSADLGGKLIMI